MNTKMRMFTSILLMTMSGSIGAAESIPRSGTISGVFGWHYSSGQNIAVDKDHVIWGGVVSGPFVGDGGQGLLHGTATSCTFSGEFRKGTVTHNSGDCVVTDADGDKVTMYWTCTKCPNQGRRDLSAEWGGTRRQQLGLVAVDAEVGAVSNTR